MSAQYVFVRTTGWEPHTALPFAAGSGALLGIGKELYDATRPHRRASGKDLAADGLGIALAAGLILLSSS